MAMLDRIQGMFRKNGADDPDLSDLAEQDVARIAAERLDESRNDADFAESRLSSDGPEPADLELGVLSLPVLLGTAGGLGLLIGPAGLLWLNLRRAPAHGDPRQRPMDRAFIALLLATSASGLALLAWRTSTWMPALLALHLGVVMALFLTLPYGKFAHGVYRTAALLKSSFEKRTPSTLKLGAD